jgi:hypothetical protein
MLTALVVVSVLLVLVAAAALLLCLRAPVEQRFRIEAERRLAQRQLELLTRAAITQLLREARDPEGRHRHADEP